MRLIHRTAVVATALSLPLAALPIAASAQQESPKRLEPDGPWRLGKAGDGCSVTRDFGTGEDRVTFSMQRVHPGAEIQFGLFGTHIKRQKDEVSAGFQPASKANSTDRIADASLDGVPGIVFAGFEFPELVDDDQSPRNSASFAFDYASLVAKTETFAVTAASKQPFTLQTNSPEQALSALENCLEAKLAALGITADLVRRTVTGPSVRNFENWASRIQQHYPADALRYNRDGVVSMRLIVSPDGKVEHCVVMTHLTAKSLRDVACASMMEYAEYDPARDSAGNAVRGIAMQRIRFSLARTFDVDAHGLKVKD